MMVSYIQLKNQIQKLEREAESLRKRERNETVAKIKVAIAAFELTAKDLGLSGTKFGHRVRKAKKNSESGDVASAKNRGRPPKSAGGDKRSLVAPKYRDSATGSTWTGRGKQPKWLAAAIQSGKKLEDFKI